MVNQTFLKIGDVSFSILNSRQINDWEIAPAYTPFVREDDPDITMRLVRGMTDTGKAEKRFDTPPIWSLHQSNGRSILKIFENMPGLARALVLEDGYDSANLYFPDATDQFVDPFYGPVLELLMITYLARGRGIILHSCSVKIGAKGILFVGESGAGKSTLTRLWNREKDVEILSDDRTIVRKKDGAYRIYGTPWHGEAKFGSPGSVRLDKIFFIRHGKANALRQIKAAEPVRHLLTCSFPPYWDTDGMEFTMDFFADLTATIPCYEMYFRPDKDIVNFVMGNLAK